MKRWISYCIVVALLLSGCTKTPEISEPLPDTEIDNSGEKTVVYRGDKDFTLSFTMDGEQKIENGIHWHYELEAYDKEWETPFYTYDIKKQELNGSKSYDKLKNCFATNGNWPLFLNPVHTEYSTSNQDKVDDSLTAHVEQQLAANQMDGAAVLITDVWACDMNRDGVQETIFKACNCDENSESGGYCLLGLYNGESCQGIYSVFKSGEAPDVTLSPLVCDLNGDSAWSLLLHKSGDYESFTVFEYTNGNISKSYEIIY